MGVKTGLSTAPFLFFLSPVFSPCFLKWSSDSLATKEEKKSLNVSSGVMLGIVPAKASYQKCTTDMDF